jgi:hypothetical protein
MQLRICAIVASSCWPKILRGLFTLERKNLGIDGGGLEILADPRDALGFRFKEGTCD